MSSSAPPPPDPSPYPGQRPFRTDESDLFFGRDAAIDRVLAKLHQQRLVVLVGPQKSGKTSFVEAGVLPALEGGVATQPGARWHVARFSPTAEPLEALAAALLASGVFGNSTDDATRATRFLAATLGRGPRGLAEALRERPAFQRRQLVIVVDHFEPQATSDDESRRWWDLLCTASADRELTVHVVLVLNGETLDSAARWIGTASLRADALLLLPPLTRDEMTAAIAGPAAVRGIRLDEALVQEIVNQLTVAPWPLPALQATMQRLWQRSCSQAASDDAGPLSLADLDAIGGVAAIESSQSPARSVSTKQRAVELRGASGSSASPSAVPLPPPLPQSQSPPTTDRTLAGVPASSTNSNWGTVGASIVAVAAIMAAFFQWQRGQSVREDVRKQTVALERKQHDLDAALESSESLAQEKRAAESGAQQREQQLAALRLAASSALASSTDPVRGVVFAVRAARLGERDALQEPLVERALRDALAGCTGRMLGDGQVPYTAVALSHDERWLAVAGSDRSLQLWDLHSTEPARAALVLPPSPGVCTELAFSADGDTLLGVGRESAFAATWQLGNPMAPARLSPLAIAENVQSVQVNSQANCALAIDAARRVAYWDLSATPPMPRALNTSGARAAAFRVDGQQWVILGDRLELWAPDQNEPTAFFELTADEVRDWRHLAISDDGLHIAAADAEGDVFVWELTPPTATAVSDLPAAPGGPAPAASPAPSEPAEPGATPEKPTPSAATPPTSPSPPAAASDTATDDADTKKSVPPESPMLTRWAASRVQLLRHERPVRDLVFAPHGRLLFTAGSDGRVRVWNITLRGMETRGVELPGHAGAVSALTTSASGAWLASASDDGTARVWSLSQRDDVSSGIWPDPGIGFEPRWSAGGPWSADVWESPTESAVRLWQLEGPTAPHESHRFLVPEELLVDDIILSPDGRFLAAACRARSVDIAPVARGILVWSLDRATLDSPPVRYAWDEPDWRAWTIGGNRLGVLTADGTLRLWDLSASDAPSPPMTLADGTNGLRGLLISADGQRLLTHDGATSLSVWRVSDRAPPRKEFTLPIRSGLVTPQGVLLGNSLVVLADADGAFQVSPGGGAPDYRIAPSVAPSFAQLSPDQRWLLIGAATGDLLLRSLERDAPHEIRLTGHRSEMTDARFSPNHQWLATTAGDEVRVWELADQGPRSTPIVVRGVQAPLLAFSPDSRELHVFSAEGRIQSARLPAVGESSAHRAERLQTYLDAASRAAGRALARPE